MQVVGWVSAGSGEGAEQASDELTSPLQTDRRELRAAAVACPLVQAPSGSRCEQRPETHRFRLIAYDVFQPRKVVGPAEQLYSIYPGAVGRGATQPVTAKDWTAHLEGRIK